MRALGCVLHFGRHHQKTFAAGAVAAFAVVAMRIALPWPIKAIVQPWIDTPGTDLTFDYASIAVLGATFIAFASLLGLADLVERLQFAKFSIGMVKDLRAAAFEAVRRSDGMDTGTGELVARLIGDTARIKSGIKGFLVHVATNTILLIGVTSVLLWLYPPMGMVFGGSCLALLAVTTIGGAVMHKRAARYRHKEGRLAEHIHDALSGETDFDTFGEINDDSSSVEASLTHMQGRATWAAHALFGFSVLAAVALGVHGVSVDALKPSTLVAIAMYAMMLRGPMVQIVRQGTRTGKIIASLDRVIALLDQAPQPGDATPTTLNTQIHIEGIRERSRKALGRTPSLRIESLLISAGSRVAIVGKRGAGKTTLLRILAGFSAPRRGSITLDAHPLVGTDHAAYASAEPTWPRRRLGDVIGITSGSPNESHALQLLDSFGANRLVKSIEFGLDTKLESAELSLSERKAIAATHAALSAAPLVLLDDPVADLTKSEAAKRVRSMLEACHGKTVIASFRRPPPPGLFDRVITLHSAKITQDTAADSKPNDPKASSSVYEVAS